VADMTFCSHGAYFEAGYAMALGRKVVFTCREDHWDHIHFDTAQYPYIKWTTPEDLREKLRDWLLALKGQGG
jgi:nucleoside 2-deoxyribosyltransferase